MSSNNLFCIQLGLGQNVTFTTKLDISTKAIYTTYFSHYQILFAHCDNGDDMQHHEI